MSYDSTLEKPLELKESIHTIFSFTFLLWKKFSLMFLMKGSVDEVEIGVDVFFEIV